MRSSILILAAGTMGMLATLPGQTNGVSPFTDHLISSLDISRSAISLAYLGGTVASALCMPAAGSLYDRWGSKRISLMAGAALGGSVIALSYADRASGALSAVFPWMTNAASAVLVMTAGFFLIRFFGQGILNISSRSMVMKWFDHRRGAANAVLSPAAALGFAFAPLGFDMLITSFGWRGAWRLIGVFLMSVFVLVVLLFYADPTSSQQEAIRRIMPKDIRLMRTLKSLISRKRNFDPPRPLRDYTLREARRTYVFWYFNIATGFASLVGTGFTFHVVGIFASAGMSRTAALAVFFPATMLAVIVQSLSSVLSDFVRLRWFPFIQMTGLLIMMWAVLILSEGLPYLLLILGLGLNTAMNGIVGIISWPRFFGLRHLGKITGANFVWVVGGSALGPYLYSLSDLIWGTYLHAAIVFALIAAVLLVLSFLAENPNKADSINPVSLEQNVEPR